MGTDALWFDLGQTMRRIRDHGGLSLARAADVSGWTKGTLSQVELGKARPSRKLVDWYDTFFACHGMLLAIYAEARASGSSGRPRPEVREPAPDAPASYPIPDDEVLLVGESGLAHGQMVSMSEELEIIWTLRNCGTVPWRDRWMVRMGPYAGGRVISSPRRSAIPDLGPDEFAEVRCPLRAPYTGGTYIAYWKMADGEDAFCFPQYSPVSVLIVVEQPLYDPRDGVSVESPGNRIAS